MHNSVPVRDRSHRSSEPLRAPLQARAAVGSPEGHIGDVKVLHVMTALQVFPHVALARGTKGFNGKELALLHLGLLPALHNGHALARMDLVRVYAVPVQIAYALHCKTSESKSRAQSKSGQGVTAEADTGGSLGRLKWQAGRRDASLRVAPRRLRVL
jgi:hypothetical protein